jgi:hypothetical protein
MGAALEDFSDLARNPRFGNDDWTADLAVSLATIKYAHLTLSGLNPPADLYQFHQSLLDGTRDCDAAAELIADGVDNLDAGYLQRAGELLQICGQKVSATMNGLQ